MRKLLLFFVFVLTAIGVKAYQLDLDQTWTADGVTEKVAKISLANPGELASALDSLNSQMTDYQHLYISNGAGFTLTDEDIAALGTVTCPTLDLQNLYVSSNVHYGPFTFSNASIKRVILPDYWDKAAVKAAAEAIVAVNTGFEAALSQHGDKEQQADTAKLVAYVQKPGTLYTAMRHTFFDSRADHKMGRADRYNKSFEKLGYVSIMGYPSARDFSGNGNNSGLVYDPNGHFVFDREADETSTTANAGIGGTRALVGTAKDGAIIGANLIQLDLEDAVIYEEWCNDLTLSWCNTIGDRTKEIIFPTNQELKTIPADCLNTALPLLEEICIPGNIENIKTRSFWISNQVLRHIWTTGTTENMVYDNGAYLRADHDTLDHIGHAPLTDTIWNNGNGKQAPARYGTITLPENLKLIESHSFSARSVSDVYVLNKTAPECHVDAFSTIMYMGNNTIDNTYTANQGMITRWSYAQGDADAEYITFLHYPRESGTPDIQRFTDPTREYSVATTWRDGKGNVVYFPNQSEFNRAYIQGTTGYLWYAWDSERVPEPSGNANSFVNVNPQHSGGHTTAIQEAANGYYIDNTMTDPDKTDRSFYDVRLDTNGQPTLTKPSDLQWYYQTIWEGQQLYPQAKSETSYYVYVRDDEGDYVKDPSSSTTDVFRAYAGSADDQLERYSRKQVLQTDGQGNLTYESCTDGDYVQNYEWVADDDGLYIHDVSASVETDGDYVLDYTFTEDIDGTYYHPLTATAAPADVWTGQYEPSDYYWGTKIYTQDDDGEYVKVWDGAYFTEENVPDYAKSNFDNAKGNPANHYSLTITGYTQCTSRDDVNNHSSDLFQVGNGYALYDLSVTDYIIGVNDTKYRKDYLTNYRPYDASTDAGETRYDVDDRGYKVDDGNYTEEQHYAKVYDGTYRLATEADAGELRYCTVSVDYVSDSSITYTVQNDYRGWHQFVLHAYATNDDRPFTPVKFYQTDNDWWTVCLPYDLKYSEMIRFFGNGENNIPYLSKLRYVVRDYDKAKITLMFSKNLMVYKEDIAATNPSATDDFVHGVIDDDTKWTDSELAADPIILHKGVPYLIKPNIDVNAGRSFDVFKIDNEDLYNRLNDAQNVDAGALETYIYKGEYTVPAYVIGENIPETTVDSKSFTHAAGPTFTYNSSDQITYGGKQVSAQISNDFSYTFVGSFFHSMMPENCYFLGWDSKKKCAAFWFNRVTNKASYDWNNQTGIICPNFNTSLQIDPASSLSDPARWIFSASDIANDDLVGVASGAKQNTLALMDLGSIDVVVSGIGQINVDKASADVERADVVYDMRGVRMSQPLNRLPKGVYIVNGKKYVVE